MTICSKNELQEYDHIKKSVYKKFKYTTNQDKISSFIISNKNSPTIMCCTYQSLETFINSIPPNTKIGFASFDEAHRCSSSKYKKLIFSANTFYNIGGFFLKKI